LYQEQAYNVVTKLSADIIFRDQLFQTVDYTYVVNGQTYVGLY
jgi:hypothetical protein